MDPTVSDVGENALLELIGERSATPPAGEVWAGDDAAVIRPGDGGMLLLTTDILVEMVDFDLQYASAGDVAWKAVAANVSDIAAMGGAPAHAVVSMVLRGDLQVAWIEDFLDGLEQAAKRWRISLAGGDISGGSEIAINVALLGRPPDAPVLRSGATEGDELYVTGRLGGAAGGLHVLREGARKVSPAHERLALRQLRPEPRLEAGRAAARAGATAMIDVSDGLALDLWRLCEASEVGCLVDPDAVPVDEDLSAIMSREDARDTSLIGGEDLELLYAVPRERSAAAAGAMAGCGVEISRIGSITTGERLLGETPLDDWRRRGWEHLRSP